MSPTSKFGASLSLLLLSTLIGCATESAESNDPVHCEGKCDDDSDVPAGESLRWAVGTCRDNYETGVETADTPDASDALAAQYAECVATAVDRAVPAVEAEYPRDFDHDETLLLDAVSDLRGASACQIVGEANFASSWDIHISISLCQARGETLMAHELATLAFGLDEEHADYDNSSDAFYAACGAAFDAATDVAPTQVWIASAAEDFASCVRNKIQNEVSPLIALRRQDIGATELGIQAATEEVNVQLDAHFDHVNTFCSAVAAPGEATGFGAPVELGLCKARGFSELGKQLRDFFPPNT